MGGYVAMDKDLDDDGRTLALRDDILEHWVTLGVPAILRDALKPFAHEAALGALYKLWRHGDTHLRHGVTGDAPGDAPLRFNRVTIALRHLAEVTGLPVTLLRRLPSQWLIEHDDGTVELPGYATKNTLQDKDERREKRNARQARYRAREKAKRDAASDVTGDGAVTSTGVTPNPTQPKEEESPQTPRRGANGHTAVRSEERQRKDASRQAWVKAEIARKANDFEGLRQRDPTIAEAIRLIGGFHAIGMTNTDRMGAMRARFRETFEQLLERRSP